MLNAFLYAKPASAIMSLPEITIEARPPIPRGPRPRGARSGAVRQRDYRQRKGESRKEHIAVLDMETDPFDAVSEILPFCAELYSDKFGSIVIWETDAKLFCEKIVAAIEALPDRYTIYAHNGGKFDFMFFVHRLRGAVKFKGRAIMSCFIGNHELRDSLHILPEKLSAWKKDTFDYTKMRRSIRHRHKAEILAYLHSDCVYLFQIVKAFITEFGFKISIGQAAFAGLKKHYGKGSNSVQNVSENTDEFIRRYFLGGRVECLRGGGLFDSREGKKDYKMFDVNSMYPYCMANFEHPIGNEYNWRRGHIGKDTVFIDVECKNFGALMWRNTDDGETSAPKDGERGRFYTTIWEYNVAARHGLITDIEIRGVVDNARRSNFAEFIVPLYDKRQRVKAEMRLLRKQYPNDFHNRSEFEELKKQDLFLKYLLNNSYGKFAQNPRRFREYYYTDLNSAPPPEWMEFVTEIEDADEYRKYTAPILRTDNTAVWCKPCPSRKFNNIGTAASITGASRAVLLEAMCGAIDAIYCDTDCLIARDLSGVKIHESELGAWDIEERYDRVIIAGKKLYACEVSGFPGDHEKRIKSRCKGSPLIGDRGDQKTKNAETWKNYLDLLAGKTILTTNKTPTFNRIGQQFYMKRSIKMTAGKNDHRRI